MTVTTKTLPELWANFSKDERARFMELCVYKRLMKESTVRHWTDGSKRPRPSTQLIVVEVLKEMKYKTTATYLFAYDGCRS